MVNGHTIVTDTHKNNGNQLNFEFWSIQKKQKLKGIFLCVGKDFLMNTVPKTKESETKVQSQPIVYIVKNRKFIVDTIYKDKPAKTLDEILLKLIKKDIEKT